MSYENNACPCGGRKERETMICAECADHIESTNAAFDMKHLKDDSFPVGTRRGMAIRVLTISRNRKRSKMLPLAFSA